MTKNNTLVIADSDGNLSKEMYWKPFLGNNHNYFPQSNTHKYGSISFRKYLDKELCQELWDDLLYRLHIGGLRIYRYDEAQWTDGRIGRHVDIHLNIDNTIGDIYYHP